MQALGCYAAYSYVRDEAFHELPKTGASFGVVFQEEPVRANTATPPEVPEHCMCCLHAEPPYETTPLFRISSVFFLAHLLLVLTRLRLVYKRSTRFDARNACFDTHFTHFDPFATSFGCFDSLTVENVGAFAVDLL